MLTIQHKFYPYQQIKKGIIIKKVTLLLVMSLIVLPGCSLSLYTAHLELRKNVIPINSSKVHKFSVGKVMVGETPGAGFYSASINPEDIAGALKTNLKNYNLLENEIGSGKYKIDLDIDFYKSGFTDFVMKGVGKYLITNINNNSTLLVTVNESYTAEFDVSFNSLIIGGVIGGVVGGPVGGGVGGSVAIQEADKALANKNNAPVSLTTEDKIKLKNIGYAPDGIPTNAHSGEFKMLRAYEGSIRLNIATFIERLQSLELP